MIMNYKSNEKNEKSDDKTLCIGTNGVIRHL